MAEEILSPLRRRRLLQIMLGAIGLALAGIAGWPLWRFLAPEDRSDARQKVTVSRAEIAVGAAHTIEFRGRPAIVLHSSPGIFVAFSAVCTHLGCIVRWLPERGEFLCPCHAGRFSAEGQVLSGPPPQPLERLPVTVDAVQVVIG